jgi:hypothetical protein
MTCERVVPEGPTKDSLNENLVYCDRDYYRCKTTGLIFYCLPDPGDCWETLSHFFFLASSYESHPLRCVSIFWQKRQCRQSNRKETTHGLFFWFQPFLHNSYTIFFHNNFHVSNDIPNVSLLKERIRL